MKRRSDDLDKWIAILSKLAQCEDGASDDQKLGLSFYAIRSTAVSDYHKLTEILADMETKGFIEVFDDLKTNHENGEAKIKRYKITLKGINTLFQILIPARDALSKIGILEITIEENLFARILFITKPKLKELVFVWGIIKFVTGYDENRDGLR